MKTEIHPEDHPYRYTGSPGLVGRHGQLKKGDIVFLTRTEQGYVSRNSQRDFARMTGEEAAKVDRSAAVQSEPIGDPRHGAPIDDKGEGAEAGTPGTGEGSPPITDEAAAELLAQEIKDTAELLTEQHTVAELKELLTERNIEIPKGATKPALVDLLAPAIVEENRAAAAANDKPANE